MCFPKMEGECRGGESLEPTCSSTGKHNMENVQGHSKEDILIFLANPKAKWEDPLDLEDEPGRCSRTSSMCSTNNVGEVLYDDKRLGWLSIMPVLEAVLVLLIFYGGCMAFSSIMLSG